MQCLFQTGSWTDLNSEEFGEFRFIRLLAKAVGSGGYGGDSCWDAAAAPVGLWAKRFEECTMDCATSKKNLSPI